eukprot:CAMPEP_0204519540 /NCGR_PEP_ID=MMETSP0661-20131031/4786_1 /ASSEMBLY_ACC=CAM_ASM_000606 /TAXON_ID=109239 /ORGANISM="Alexandrium margalefi, Strain AMGDE01CS-322" /LENGTH=107 /DNA_ID=CAMNT_0051525049 /DNA_START=217 /DNA_END=537 /DNA_ORIENTATION=-
MSAHRRLKRSAGGARSLGSAADAAADPPGCLRQHAGNAPCPPVSWPLWPRSAEGCIFFRSSACSAVARLGFPSDRWAADGLGACRNREESLQPWLEYVALCLEHEKK